MAFSGNWYEPMIPSTNLSALPEEYTWSIEL